MFRHVFATFNQSTELVELILKRNEDMNNNDVEATNSE